MNKERRTRIKAQADRISDIIEDLELIREEEQEAFDNLPEGIQESEKGETMTEAGEELEEQITALQDCKDNLENYEH